LTPNSCSARKIHSETLGAILFAQEKLKFAGQCNLFLSELFLSKFGHAV